MNVSPYVAAAAERAGKLSPVAARNALLSVEYHRAMALLNRQGSGRDWKLESAASEVRRAVFNRAPIADQIAAEEQLRAELARVEPTHVNATIAQRTVDYGSAIEAIRDAATHDEAMTIFRALPEEIKARLRRAVHAELGARADA